MSDPEVTAALNKMFAHPAFPAFKKRIENFVFRDDGLITAWCWFRDGWESSTIARQRADAKLESAPQ